MAARPKKRVRVEFQLQPYELQQEIIDYMDGTRLAPHGAKYRFFVLAIGRQSGKSWLVKKIMLERAINRGQVCMLVAPALSSARRHWNDLVTMITESGMPYKKINQTAKEIQFYGGGSITIRSAVEPDNIRGDTLDFLALDEAAFFRNGKYVYFSVCLPMVSASRGDILLTSTPNGRNWFYELFQQGQNAADQYYKSWQASSYVSPFQDAALLDALRATMPEYQFREEFMAEFLADGSGVFAGAELAAKVAMLRAPLPGHDYVAGIDFGFNNDPTTFTVLDKWTRQQVYGEAFYNYGTINTVGKLTKLLHHWQPEITHLEKNGLGNPMFDILKAAIYGKDIDIERKLLDAGAVDLSEERDEEDEAFDRFSEYGLKHSMKQTSTPWHGKIRAIHMDNNVKRELVERCAAAIEYGRLELLEQTPGSYGELQINEMSTYQRKKTASGVNTTYEAAEGSHDDRVSGLYLAYKGLPPPPKPDFLKKKQPAAELFERKRSPFRGKGTIRNHRKGRR